MSRPQYVSGSFPGCPSQGLQPGIGTRVQAGSKPGYTDGVKVAAGADKELDAADHVELKEGMEGIALVVSEGTGNSVALVLSLSNVKVVMAPQPVSVQVVVTVAVSVSTITTVESDSVVTVMKVSSVTVATCVM